MANPSEWIKWDHQEWFYKDGTSKSQITKIAKAKLVEWGMFAPVMAEIEEAIRNSQPLCE